MPRIPNVLTIAGSDPSGGAGIQADHKTFAAHGVYGCSVLTACTAQNTQGVSAVHPIPPEFVAQQIATLLSDVRIDAVKTGMLASADIITEVARSLRDAAVGFVVVDPVMVSTSGHRLLEATAEDALRRQLVPLADILTPNLPEARVLTGLGDEASEDALLSALIELGPRSIYLKGATARTPMRWWISFGTASIGMNVKRRGSIRQIPTVPAARWPHRLPVT